MNQNRISQRAKANLPTVLLTLLSIVQALALELMWEHVTGSPTLYVMSFEAVLSWLQIVASLLGILLIWLIYSGLVMRFSWVPTTTDTVFPFFVGIVEFAQISALGMETISVWFVMTGLLFIVVAWISQVSMKRARQDEDNADFFQNVSPATHRDHFFAVLPAVVLASIGVALHLIDSQGWFALAAILFVLTLLLYQLFMNHRYSERSYQRSQVEVKGK